MVEKDFRKDSVDTLWIKNFGPQCVFDINTFLLFIQKFKMAAKNGEKTIFRKCHQLTLQIACEKKKLIKITLSYTVYEINA